MIMRVGKIEPIYPMKNPGQRLKDEYNGKKKDEKKQENNQQQDFKQLLDAAETVQEDRVAKKLVLTLKRPLRPENFNI